MYGQAWNKEPLGKLFREMSKGNAETLSILKKLAKTARAIDPECPHGPHGVLEKGIKKYGFTPLEINRLWRLCGADPLVMNAIDYAIYRKELSVDDLKKSMKRNFRGFNIRSILNFARRDHGRFGQYYRPAQKVA